MANLKITTDMISNNTASSDTVRKLLDLLPKRSQSYAFVNRYGLVLLTPEKNRFLLSIQASESHYCSPRETLTNLTDYNAVEIGIIPMGGEFPFQYGGSLDWDTSNFTLVTSEEGKGGWLMPSNIGFERLAKGEPHHDDVLAYVSLEDLVLDLADFFDRGGVIDGDHEETKEWLSKVTKTNNILQLTGK